MKGTGIMSKSILKRCLCVFIAAAAALSMTACKKAEAPMASKENIYKAEKIPMPRKFDYVAGLGSVGDNIYILGVSSETTGEGEETRYISTTQLSIVAPDGSEKSCIELAKDDGTGSSSKNVQRMCINDDGSVTLLMILYSWDEETGESSQQYFISDYSADGKLIKENDITDINKSDDDYVYFDTLLVDTDGTRYLSGNNSIYAIDKDGKALFTIEGEENSGGSSGSYLNGLYKTGDGRIVTIENSYSYDNDTYKSTYKAKVIDTDKKGFGDEYALPGSFGSYYSGGGDYDLYISKSNSMCGIDIETGTETTVIDWLKSGFDTTTMDSATILSDGRILCTSYEYESSGNGYSWSNSDLVLTILTKVDPSEIPDKKLIKMSVWYLNYNLKQRIVEFNNTNENYQIEVTSYNEYTDESGDYMAGLTKLNNDLIAGNIPDILVLDTSMPVDSYISKGLLADLNTFIDKDEAINKEDFLPNILDIFTVNGKLYSLSPKFTIQTIVAKQSLIGDINGWTMADYKAFEESHPDIAMFNKNDMTRDGFVSYALTYSYDSFVNRETGECYFDSDGFKQILETAKSFPEEIDWNNVEEHNWEEQEAAYREGRTLLLNAYFYNFGSIREYEQARFGDKMAFIGFPCENKNGSAIYPDLEFSITAKAKNPDGAWEFVRYFFTDEYQNQIDGSFPIRESAYPALMEKAKEKPYYIDSETGEKVEYDNKYWIANQEIDIGVNTDEDNQRMMDFIRSVSGKYSYDQELLNIINEEAASFYSGQKSVDEAASIIQNRVNIYISESR